METNGTKRDLENGWRSIETAPEHAEVWTKIDDANGERNTAKLTRHGRLWYTRPTNGMYVYYSPTHWRPTEEAGGRT